MGIVTIRTPKTVFRLPDLEQSRSAVLNSLTSPSSQRSYDHAIREFINWYCSEPRLAFNRVVVTRYRIFLEQKHYASSTINLRRAELAALDCQCLQQREDHWVFADLVGKGLHVRTVPAPAWVEAALKSWTLGAQVSSGAIFRAINKASRIADHGFSPKVIWGVVKKACATCGLAGVAPHDLRRTCARLCHESGGELDQIQFLLGHVSVQTTERYIGCKQRLRNAVNDAIGLEPETH